MRSHLLIAAIASVVSAQSDTNEAPDALDTDFLKSLPDPVVNIIPGVLDQTVSYNTQAAIATASVQVQETPLSVFPAATSVPINAAGEDGGASGSARRRWASGPSRIAAVPELVARNDCSPEPTIANLYNIDVSSYDTFMADSKIAAVVNQASAPQGYFESFKNYDAANSASAYMGYTVIDDNSGYNVDLCAQKCNERSGCLAFNIFFERDPVASPGGGCEDPAAFANIKCSFWGVPLDKSTATNRGQWRNQFHVGVAGSSAYTSRLVGGPVDGYDNPPQSLGQATMQAPLRDCAGTWTYMGYKIYQDQPFDPRLCAAACDAQTDYNLAHPPSTGKASKCAAFGTYLVSKTTSSGTVITGQMCTMYTSWYSGSLATNTGSTDGDGTKWTFSASFFYSRADRQPICSSDIDYLKQNGQDFCTAFISYSAPVTTVTTTAVPADKVVIITTSTSVVAVAGANPTTTVTGNVQWKKRQDGSDGSATATPTASINPAAEHLDVAVETIDNLGPSTIAVLSQVTAEAVPTNGTSADVARRAIATPASIAGWAPSRISEACSDVATGTVTVTATAFAASQTTTTTAYATTTLSACVVPSQVAAYKSMTPIWGVWDVSQSGPGGNPSGIYGRTAAVQLPFPYCAYGLCTNVISVNTDGFFTFTNPAKQSEVFTMNVYQGTGLYLYPGWGVGVFTRVTGNTGSRMFTLSWYASTYQWGHAVTHFTATWYEDKPNMVVYKYYDAVQVYQNNHGIGRSGSYTPVYSGFMKAGTQIQINTSANSNTATFATTQHNRIDCCTNQGWHSCTEFQPQVL